MVEPSKHNLWQKGLVYAVENPQNLRFFSQRKHFQYNRYPNHGYNHGASEKEANPKVRDLKK